MGLGLGVGFGLGLGLGVGVRLGLGSGLDDLVVPNQPLGYGVLQLPPLYALLA